MLFFSFSKSMNVMMSLFKSLYSIWSFGCLFKKTEEPLTRVLQFELAVYFAVSMLALTNNHFEKQVSEISSVSTYIPLSSNSGAKQMLTVTVSCGGSIIGSWDGGIEK